MPRSLFNLRDGPGSDKLAVDPESEELADLDAARARALDAARDMIARIRMHALLDGFAFEIEDAQCRPLLTVPFGSTVIAMDEADKGRPTSLRDAQKHAALCASNAPGAPVRTVRSAVPP